MCGIAGWIGQVNLRQPLQVLQEMTDRMAHRGPDGEGHFCKRVFNDSCQLALGHRRLSIIDLNVRSDQPLTSACGNYTIVFNGEIYNYLELREELRALGHSFHTSSDTQSTSGLN